MLQQVDSVEWPSGDSKPIALLRVEPPELHDRFGLSFEEGVDGLDSVESAAAHLATGELVLFQRHARSPEPGTEVYVDAHVEAALAIEHLIGDLGLEDTDLSWRRTDD